MVRSAFNILAMLGLGLLLSSQAAVRAAEDDGEYAQAIKLGSSEFEAGNYAEARAQFTRAHRQFPNARTLRALGMVEFELKNYGECIEYLRSALIMQVRALEPGQRREAELLLARARSYLARLTLELEPELATVLMDGVPVKPDGGRTLVVPVGDHVLEFRAPGRLSEKRLIKVSGGEERTLHVVLPSLDAPPASSAKTAREQTSQPATAASSEHAPLYKKAWLWVVVGAVVAGAAAGAAVALTRNKNHDSDTHDEPNPPTLVAP